MMACIGGGGGQSAVASVRSVPSSSCGIPCHDSPAPCAKLCSPSSAPSSSASHSSLSWWTPQRRSVVISRRFSSTVAHCSSHDGLPPPSSPLSPPFDSSHFYVACGFVTNSGRKFARGRRWRSIGTRVHAKAEDGESPPEYSADTKIRSEVLSPFRTLRMFFYLAFAASGSIGALTTLPRLAAALTGAANAQPVLDVAKDLGIDVAAITVFALLYRSDSRARDVSLARLSREEMLSALRVEVATGAEKRKAVSLQQLRGAARVVIMAGSGEYVREAMRRGETYRNALLERGVLVVPYSSDGEYAASESTGVRQQQAEGAVAVQQQRWTASPVYTGEWAKWLNAQKKLANVADDVPVYISLRLDGRVRGSGVGYPPWQRLSVQLPPMAGMWKGPLDGMDGRV